MDSLKAICDILYSTTGNDAEETTSHAVDWFNELSQTFLSNDPLYPKEVKGTLVIPRLLQLLRQCLLTQRDNSTAAILNNISSVPHKLPNVLWKTSMELLYRNPDNSRLVDQIVNQFKWLAELNAKEVVLEYIMFLLDVGRTEDARQAFQELPKTCKRLGWESEDRNSQYIHILFKAYHGLVWYVEWLARKEKSFGQNSGTDGTQLSFGADSFSQNVEEIMASCATKAIACFDILKGEVGVWDIFITKHVELLTYYGRSEEAKILLQDYRDRNMENPNCHKYFYNFICEEDAPVSEKINILKVLAEHVPSDSLVLELCHMLIDDDEVESALPYLFCLLDYGSWMWKEKPWEMLSCLFHDASARPSTLNIVKECWDIRSSWWPFYHFSFKSKCQIDETGCQLCLYKAKCAVYLMGKNCVYAVNIRDHLNESQLEELDTVNQKITAVT